MLLLNAIILFVTVWLIVSFIYRFIRGMLSYLFTGEFPSDDFD